MAWIESNQELARHPKAKKAARTLDISIPAIIGHLHFLWWWCLEYAQDGDLSQFDESDIADAAGWEGEPRQFIQALIDCGPGESIGFLEQMDNGGIAVHDWMDYAGRLIEKRQANTKRMRSARAKHVQRTCDERATHVQGLPYPTVPNLTVPNTTNIDNDDNIAHQEIVLALEEIDNPVDKLMDLTTDPKANAIVFAQANFGYPISPTELEQIVDWVKLFKEQGSLDPEAIVIAGLQACVDHRACNMAYLKKIMIRWSKNGVTTMEHVVVQNKLFEEGKSGKRAGPSKDKPERKTSPEKYGNFYL